MATEAERWVTGKQHPLEPALRRGANIVLGDPRMKSYVKYGNLHFGYVGDMASFVQIANKKLLTLMFHRGAKLGDSPSFTGDGHSARFITFTSVAEVNARAGELRQLVARWCDLMDDEAARASSQPARAAAKATRKPAAKPARKPTKTSSQRPQTRVARLRVPGPAGDTNLKGTRMMRGTKAGSRTGPVLNVRAV
jgi:hypothetical protein